MTIATKDGVFGGEPHLADRRITVLQIVEPVLDGHEPATVADQLDVSLGEVHEALAYYYNHPDEMASIRDADADLESRLDELSNAPREATQ